MPRAFVGILILLCTLKGVGTEAKGPPRIVRAKERGKFGVAQTDQDERLQQKARD